ncbi:MAG: lipoprotein insertase outer membrane protein LolB [Rhodanobacter sp.]
MKFLSRLLLVAVPLALAACAPAVRIKGDSAMFAAQATREAALARVDHWTLSGRLGLTSANAGGSGSFTWTQDGQRYVFELRGPLASKSFRLSGGPQGALLEGLEGGPVHGADAEELMRKALGWVVPLRDLRAWILGLRADSGPAELSFGADGLPSLLRQDGWVVDYRQWDTGRQPPLPQKVFAEKAPYKVKLLIESWQFP